MEKVGKTRCERLIIAVLVVCAAIELCSWLFPRPYRWAGDDYVDSSLLEVDGRQYVMFDSGYCVEVKKVSE